MSYLLHVAWQSIKQVRLLKMLSANKIGISQVAFVASFLALQQFCSRPAIESLRGEV